MQIPFLFSDTDIENRAATIIVAFCLLMIIGFSQKQEQVFNDNSKSQQEKHVVDSNQKAQSKNEASDRYITISSKDDKFWYAVTAAQNLVKEQLKSHSTAKFPKSGDSCTVSRKDNAYTVNGYVDAQNSYGATLRKEWSVSFTMGDTSGKTYKVSNYKVNICD